jgi:ABC-type multidrug transport system fused ATPase/permease subunit
MTNSSLATSEMQRDSFYRMLLTLFWLGLLGVFYFNFNVPAFTHDLWNSESNTFLKSKESTQVAELIVVSKKSNEGIASVLQHKIQSFNIIDSSSSKVRSIINAVQNSDDTIRFISKNKLVNYNLFINLWKVVLFLLIIAVLFCIIFIIGLKKCQKIWSWCQITIIIIIAILHFCFIFLFGGIFLSPFGIIASSVISTVIAYDVISYNNTKKRIVFWRTAIFILTTVAAFFIYV